MGGTDAEVRQASESRLRALFEDAPLPTWELDLSPVVQLLVEHGVSRSEELAARLVQEPEVLARCAALVRIVDSNRAARTFAGARSREEMNERDAHGIRPEAFAAAGEPLAALWLGATTATAELTLPMTPGEVRGVSVHVSVCSGHEASLSRVIVTVLDVTERRRAEATLRRREQRQQLALSAGGIGTFDMDLASGMGDWSPEVAELWGMPPGYAGSLAELCWKRVHPEDIVRVQAEFTQAIARGGSTDLEFRVLRPDGTVRWLRWRGQVTRDVPGGVEHILGVNMDITERRRLEDAFRQAQKMEAFGQLAAGIAHDFNNLLTVMVMDLALIQEEAEAGEHRRPLTEIGDAVARATNLTRQLLTFSRRQPQLLGPLDLNHVVANVTRMLVRLIGEQITLTEHLTPEGALVHADSGMMEQVLVNLAVNARDAMPAGGRLDLHTEVVTLDENEARTRPRARAGRFVRLTVADTGTGVAPEHVARLFEPFFTTKEVGKGTGLGLATVFGIVAQHQGWIDVESALGVGTAFRVYLPLIDAPPVTPRLAHSREPASAPRTTDAILVVEDEPAVLRLLRRLLEGRGYRVLTAANGVDGLRVWEEHKAEISLLLTDMVMPGGIGGLQLSTQMRADKPNLKVIYSSGYVPDGLDLSKLHDATFLAKPFSAEALLAAVARLLVDDA
jgi:PAS domain S-box-containing protein